MTRAREPFGRLLSRKVTARTYSRTLPGAPDGAWRVAGYFVR